MTRLGVLPGTLKDAMEQDPGSTLKTLAEIGFAGVEKPVASVDGAPETIAISTGWDAWPDGWDYLQEGKPWDPASLDQTVPGIAKEAKDAGARYVVLYWGPADNKDQVLRLAHMLDEMGKRLAAEGLSFCYHNHDHEFKQVFDGERAIDLLLAHTGEGNVGFEFDLGWVRYGGEEPAAWVRRHGHRAPLIHLRDVDDPAKRGNFILFGLGCLDLRAIRDACEERGVDWLILEPNKHDGVDAMDYLRTSVTNLRALGALPTG